MTSNPTRRTILTGTAASAVAAAVPASAAVSRDTSALTGSQHRDGIWRVATQMPRNARAWIDAARAAGFTVGIGYADGKPGVVSGFDGVPSDVRDLVQAWGNGIPTAEIVDELEAEESGPNDRRLSRLAQEYRQIVEQNWEDDTPRKREIMGEMLNTPADSIVGVAAKLHAVAPSRAPEPSAPGDALEHRAMAEVERLGGFAPESD